jgi:hypothetical protein
MLVDFLWIPLVARAKDLDLGSSFLGLVFAMNLGARFIPNIVVTKFGVGSELVMMSLVFFGYTVSMAWPDQPWAYVAMGFCSGLGFVRACLTLHPQMAFGDNEEAITRAARLSGSARNLGTITALTVPVVVYERFGWCAVCAIAIAVVTLYLTLALIQHVVAARLSQRRSQNSTIVAVCEEATSQTSRKTSRPIPWIYWVIGSGFVVTELQFNMCNAAVPITLTRTFDMHVSQAGCLMAAFNAISMVFLAALPSVPCPLLHRSPFNMMMSFGGMVMAWSAAVFATTSLESLGAGSVYFFTFGVLLFLLAGYLAQVLMLEALTGVLDLSDAKVLMGVSETLGCGFAVMGGYLGDRLEVYGAAAPYLLQASVALITFVGLAVSLGHRQITTSDQAATMGVLLCADSSSCWGYVNQSLDGIRAMTSAPHSFIALERQYLSMRSSQIRRHFGRSGSRKKQTGAALEPLLGSAPASLA